MAEKQQMTAPSGMAGLVRYYDEDKALIKLKPEHVIVLCGMLCLMEIVLFAMFKV